MPLPRTRDELVNVHPIAVIVLGRGILLVAAAVLFGCSTFSPGDRAAKRAELDDMAHNAIAALLDAQPEVREIYERSAGYMVIDMQVTKIPVFGAGGGLGVVVDNRTDSRSYIKVSRFEVGGGLGAQRYRVIVFFDDGDLVDRVRSGAWHYDVGAEASAGAASAASTAKAAGKGYHAFKLSEGGAAVTVTVRVAYSKPYLE